MYLYVQVCLGPHCKVTVETDAVSVLVNESRGMFSGGGTHAWQNDETISVFLIYS